mmetsp:Transcript_82633/g.256693  ORF Transcript_82633/g.256693 Transcript_82633/m.256693 type:complete len:730 (+) Transcript_82633:71-2260(+)
MAYTAAWKHALLLCTTTAYAEMMKGISYGPVPLKSNQGASQLPQDDWMCGEAVAMWGRAGRGDLRHMRALGANVVRLYGNNPDNDHTTFLDEAHMEGLGVLPGMSDHPFYQQTLGNCQETNYNCFTQIKPQYLKNLNKGFLLMDRRYHPALRVVNILNEPDLKMPHDTTTGGSDGPVKMARAVISAFDAMLEAEKEAGVVGPLVNFTATFSYAICSVCTRFPSNPALGQIAQLQDAMYHPENYNYTPNNNITAAFEARWVHSFNTQNPATDLQGQFLDGYNGAFPNTPVYIGEYHRVGANQTQDLRMILDIAKSNPLFQGVSFFEYQVAYWKTGSEMAFGMLGLGNYKIADMPYFGKIYDVWCLQPVQDAASGGPMADAVASVFGGSPMDASKLCVQNPLRAALGDSGFATIASQNSASQMALYVEHVLQHMGATVANAQGLNSFAAGYVGAASSAFPAMMSHLGARPAWAAFDPSAKCLANRHADPGTVGTAIGWACQNANPAHCNSIPLPCQRSPYLTADYVFSRYYQDLTGNVNPLTQCDFGGAGMFASSQVYSGWSGASECAAGSTFVFPTTAAPTSTVPATTAAPAGTTAQPSTGAATTAAATTSGPASSSSTGPSTGTPTPAPTPAPTPSPTPAPIPGSTPAPTPATTPATTSGPTSAPTPATTGAPTSAPTGAPTSAPTPTPTSTQHPSPTEVPSGAAVLRPGLLSACQFALLFACWTLLWP